MPDPIRTVRVADEVWLRAQVRARNEGTTVSAVIVERLTEYGSDEPQD